MFIIDVYYTCDYYNNESLANECIYLKNTKKSHKKRIGNYTNTNSDIYFINSNNNIVYSDVHENNSPTFVDLEFNIIKCYISGYAEIYHVNNNTIHYMSRHDSIYTHVNHIIATIDMQDGTINKYDNFYHVQVCKCASVLLSKRKQRNKNKICGLNIKY